MDNVTVISKSKLDINIDDITDYFIVVFKDLKNEYKMYFTEYDYNDIGLKITGTNPALDINIATNYKEEGYYTSEFGEIDSVINLQDLIVTYYEIKKVYKPEEINSILEKYAKDYNNLITKEEVKKLNLKYVEK